MADAGPRVRIGVAGWDYADWIGPVYPSASAKRIDKLAFISRFVDVIEINSTFYRPAAPRTAESWLRRTRQRRGFTFTAKAHRSWTHEPDVSGLGAIQETLSGLRPLRDAGRLAAVLLQFPQSFHYDEAARARLARLVDVTRGWPVVVEVRHAGWHTRRATAWFAGLGVGWCVVDQPRVSPTQAGPARRVCGALAYLRLHGRNVADWFRVDADRDARYDYLYSASELRGLVDLARGLGEQARELVVIQNNHFRGQALVNALQLRHLLSGARPAAPATLVDAYPHLAEQTRVERDTLF